MKRKMRYKSERVASKRMWRTHVGICNDVLSHVRGVGSKHCGEVGNECESKHATLRNLLRSEYEAQ